MSVSYGPAAEAGLFVPSYIPQSKPMALHSKADQSNDYINKGSRHFEMTGAYYNKIYPYYPNAPTYKEISKAPGTDPNIPKGDFIPQNIKFSRSYLGSGMIAPGKTSNKIRY
jgi:hypothetical protein